MEYVEFRIRVRDTKNISASRQNCPVIDTTVQYDALQEKTIRVLRRLVARDDTRIEDLEVLGSHLYGVLFSEDVGREFQEAHRQKGNATLRVVLEFLRDARDLATLPWEYLYVPDDRKYGKGFFIAVENRLILSRHVPLTIENQDALRPQETALKVLLVVSQPKYEYVQVLRDGSFTDERTEMGTVTAGPVIEMLDSLASKSNGRIEIIHLRQPTKRTFAEALIDHKPHIVHFIGHGRYQNDEGALALIKATGGDSEALWLDQTGCTDFFKDIPSPRLIFLHACEGARSDSYEAFSGVALQLVYSRMPAVVAMQYPITNNAAITFARRLYEALSRGCAIDEAVQLGRNELKMNLDEQEISDHSFGIPVVFLQSKDARSLQGIVINDAPAAPAPAAGRDYRCPNPACRKPINPDRRFCPNPGCRMQFKFCSNCGEAIAADATFCDNCGKDVDTVATAVPAAAAATSAARRPGEF